MCLPFVRICECINRAILLSRWCPQWGNLGIARENGKTNQLPLPGSLSLRSSPAVLNYLHILCADIWGWVCASLASWRSYNKQLWTSSHVLPHTPIMTLINSLLYFTDPSYKIYDSAYKRFTWPPAHGTNCPCNYDVLCLLWHQLCACLLFYCSVSILLRGPLGAVQLISQPCNKSSAVTATLMDA